MKFGLELSGVDTLHRREVDESDSERVHHEGGEQGVQPSEGGHCGSPNCELE